MFFLEKIRRRPFGPLTQVHLALAQPFEQLGRRKIDQFDLLGLIQQGLTPAPADAPASGGASALLPRLWRRRDLRAFTGWSDTALKVHLGRLVELEYVLPRRDPKHAQSLCYELLYDGDAFSGRPHLSGLLDVAELRAQPADPKGPNA